MDRSSILVRKYIFRYLLNFYTDVDYDDNDDDDADDADDYVNSVFLILCNR